MTRELASVVDVVHALAMVAWVIGVPLLFWHRWPRLSVWYARYAVGFAVLNVGSQWLIDECFLTTLSRWLWTRGGPAPNPTEEWFSVRFAESVFGLTPTHELVKRLTEAMIVVTAVGTLWTLRRTRRSPGATTPSAP